MWYGFPDTGDGVKVALHHHGPATEPEAVNRVVHPAEAMHLRSLVDRYLPAASGALRETGVCTYTNAPDEQFIIDRHPLADRVIVASPCSGHGFKFASAIGEVLADLVQGGTSRFDLAPFALKRPALQR
jgi:sarcosine oxidase